MYPQFSNPMVLVKGKSMLLVPNMFIFTRT